MSKQFKFFRFLILSVVALSCGGNAQNLKEGDVAPDFTLPDAFGNNYTLSAFQGKSPVVIYFYPAANTAGCTKQACGIRDSWSRFRDKNIIVLGVSVDSREKIKKFIQDYNLNFPLLSDEDKSVSRTYGVLNNFGIDSRITFIINKEGKIYTIIRDVDVETHADQVYEIASKL
jgi:peroxiredoxin Q/BCP